MAEACPLDDVGLDRVLRPADALRGMPRVTAGDELATSISHGRVLTRDALQPPWPEDSGPWAVVDEAGALLAVYQAGQGGRVKPCVVLTARA